MYATEDCETWEFSHQDQKDYVTTFKVEDVDILQSKENYCETEKKLLVFKIIYFFQSCVGKALSSGYCMLLQND